MNNVYPSREEVLRAVYGSDIDAYLFENDDDCGWQGQDSDLPVRGSLETIIASAGLDVIMNGQISYHETLRNKNKNNY